MIAAAGGGRQRRRQPTRATVAGPGRGGYVPRPPFAAAAAAAWSAPPTRRQHARRNGRAGRGCRGGKGGGREPPPSSAGDLARPAPHPRAPSRMRLRLTTLPRLACRCTGTCRGRSTLGGPRPRARAREARHRVRRCRRKTPEACPNCDGAHPRGEDSQRRRHARRRADWGFESHARLPTASPPRCVW